MKANRSVSRFHQSFRQSNTATKLLKVFAPDRFCVRQRKPYIVSYSNCFISIFMRNPTLMAFPISCCVIIPLYCDFCAMLANKSQTKNKNPNKMRFQGSMLSPCDVRVKCQGCTSHASNPLSIGAAEALCEHVRLN